MSVYSISTQSTLLSHARAGLQTAMNSVAVERTQSLELSKGSKAFYYDWIALRNHPQQEVADTKMAVQFLRESITNLEDIADRIQKLRSVSYDASKVQTENEISSLVTQADAYLSEMSTIADEANFHGLNIYDGSRSSSASFKIYQNDALDEITMPLSSMTLETLGLEDINLSSVASAELSTANIDSAMRHVISHYASLVNQLQSVDSKYVKQQADETRLHVIRGISDQVDFVTQNNFYRSFQLRDSLKLNLLDGSGITNGHFSFRV